MKPCCILPLLCVFLVVGCRDSSERTPSDLPTTYLDSQRQQQKVLGESTIIPGRQLGPIHLGDPGDAVTSQYGEPIDGNAAMGKSVSVYRIDGPGPPATLTVFVVRRPDTLDSGQVRLIRSDAVYFRDATGVGVGSTRREVERFYPLEEYGTYVNQEDTCRIYTTGKGISFEFGPEDRCRGVVVQPLDQVPGEPYLPIYDNVQRRGTVN